MSPESTILRTLDVAYDLESATMSEWLSRVAEQLRGLFQPYLGSYGWLLDLSDGDAKVRDVTAFGLSNEQETLIEALHRLAPKRLIERLYGPTPIETISDGMGGLTAFRRNPLVRSYLQPNGIPDCVGIRVRAGSTVLVLGAIVPAPGHMPETLRSWGKKLITHLEPAFRIQLALGSSTNPPHPQAMLTPDGRVVHAEGGAASRSARQRLAEAVRAHERLRGYGRRRGPREAIEFFEGLVAGRWTLLDRFESDGRRYLVAYENTPEAAARRALTPREREVLWRVATGVPVKRIAADLGISTGAAGAYLASARRKTGISSRIELARWFSSVLALQSASASKDGSSKNEA